MDVATAGGKASMKPSNVAFSVIRVILYIGCVVCGIGIAGIIGTLHFKASDGSNACILRVETTASPAVSCASQQQCKSSKDCTGVFSGWNCTKLDAKGSSGSFCVPARCISIDSKKGTSP